MGWDKEHVRVRNRHKSKRGVPAACTKVGGAFIPPLGLQNQILYQWVNAGLEHS
jgi:hypothetical protein